MWLNFVFNRHDKILVDMPFTAGELGHDVLRENGLEGVCIEETRGGDHFDVRENKVRIVGQRLSRKSLTAISVVCHEIGHAIHDRDKHFMNTKETMFSESIAWFLGYKWCAHRGFVIDMDEYKQMMSKCLNMYMEMK